MRDRAWFVRLYGEIILSFSEGIIDRTGAQTMLYLTCTTIFSVDLAQYGLSRAKDWVPGNCGTIPNIDYVILKLEQHDKALIVPSCSQRKPVQAVNHSNDTSGGSVEVNVTHKPRPSALYLFECVDVLFCMRVLRD